MDLALKYKDYSFLGDEFLTWVLYKSNIDSLFAFEAKDRVVLTEKLEGKVVRSVTIKGSDYEIATAKSAMIEGAIVSEIKLGYNDDILKYDFILKGIDLSINNLKMSLEQLGDDFENEVLSKIHSCQKPLEILDRVFNEFSDMRMNEEMWATEKKNMTTWIEDLS